MNDKEIAEIRRRFKSEKTGISRIRGCYVNGEREIISEMDQSVGLMSESETDQILAILKKALSGSIGTNLLDIAFTTQDVMVSEEHKLLTRLRETGLQDDESVHALYQKIIGSLEIEGNYMILLAYDSYDVFSYHKDGSKDHDDSSEIFRYILCAVCPIKIAKPSLSYYVKENCFRNVMADSVLSAPAVGFMFPAFDNRTTNLYGALYYNKSADNNHTEFTDAVFHTGELPMPVEEQKETFRTVLAESTGDACNMSMVRSVYAQMNQAIEDHKTTKEPEPLTVDKYVIRDMLGFCGVPEASIDKFESKFDENFGEGATVSPRNIVDTKHFEVKTPDVVIKVNPAHSDLVETRLIDGVRYILVRADQGAEVNGINIQVDNE